MPGSVEPVLLRDVEFWVREGWKCGGAKMSRRSGIVYSGRGEMQRCASLFSESGGVVELKDSDEGRRRI